MMKKHLISLFLALSLLCALVTPSMAAVARVREAAWAEVTFSIN